MGLSAGEITAIGIGLGNIAAWSKLIYDARKSGKPDNGKGCPAHTSVMERIASVETYRAELTKELETLHSENREEHQRLSADIHQLSVSVVTAATAAANAAASALERAKRARR